MSKPTGGPAFPCHTNPRPDYLSNAPQGMTLRAYIATHAMAGLLADPSGKDCTNLMEIIPIASVRFADAMIAALNKPTEPTK